eukprot:CAMPEP_0197033494 /NCGR_PEP_ID=MMETSP1384-20130603/11887_1 /TAXON_ID=29189 /ORGANISM="Ammonia sp." /LENGTH=824 /DNA_ID=CAMNT_0042463307 /DNA_START=75 /DNA_END=2549 /DNA_ORIENTATION=+
MLSKSLYSEEDTSAECCSTVHCKCLNAKLDFINQSQLLSDDTNTEYEYKSLESSLDSQPGINSTLFFRAFLLSINVKFKWLIGCTLIYLRADDDEPHIPATPCYLYRCHCCCFDLFISTSNILGKCLINYELHNFNQASLIKRADYSPSFNLVLRDPATRNIPHFDGDLLSTHPLAKLVDTLRENEEAAMRHRIDEFKRREEEKFAVFCENLDKEYNILTQYAFQQQSDFDKYAQTVMQHDMNLNEEEQPVNLFNFNMASLLEIEKHFNELMEENLKLDNEEVYQYINRDLTHRLNKSLRNIPSTSMNKAANSSSSSLMTAQSALAWLKVDDLHELLIKLPLNEMGEFSNGFTRTSNHSMHSSLRNSPKKSQISPDPVSPPIIEDIRDQFMADGSPSATMVEHEENSRHVAHIDLDVNGHDTDKFLQEADEEMDELEEEDENAGFAALSDDDGEEEDVLFAMDDAMDDDAKFKMDDNEASLTHTPISSAFLGQIPELNITNQASQETVQTRQTIDTGSRSFNMEDVDVIHENSETDDRLFGIDSPTQPYTRARSTASSLSKPYNNVNASYMYSLSSNIKMKSSGARQINNKTVQSKSLLSKTLNKNSALVNLSNHSQFESQISAAKYHPQVAIDEITGDLDEDDDDDDNEESVSEKKRASKTRKNVATPKTYQPSKQWLDVMHSAEDKKHGKAHSNHSHSATKPKAIKSNVKSGKKGNVNLSGTLVVNNHTFTGIWAKTLPKQPAFVRDRYRGGDGDDEKDEEEQEQEKEDDDDDDENEKDMPMSIHGLFDRKQSEPVNNMYAYSVGPKYSAKEMDSIHHSKGQ